MDIPLSEILKYVFGAILLALCIFTARWAIVGRSMVKREEQLPIEDLERFQKMRDEGAIDDDEYKRLKKIVATETANKSKNA